MRLKKNLSKGKIIRRIMLIAPPMISLRKKDNRDENIFPPLGLAYLAAALEDSGIEVVILDAHSEGSGVEEVIDDEFVRLGLPDSKIIDSIKRCKPDMVGISCLFSIQYDIAKGVAALTKSVDKDIIVLMGGMHPTVMPESVLEDVHVDAVILGEGEETLSGLVKALNGEKKDITMDGIGFKEDNTFCLYPKKTYADINSIPLPARHLWNWSLYEDKKISHGMRKRKRFSPVISSRGCPYHCVFCTTKESWGRRFRGRDPDNVFKELVELKKRYGVEEVLFEDDNLTFDYSRAEKLFDLMIFNTIDICWDTPNGIALWTLDENLLKKMKLSGCYRINLAIESSSQDVLRNIIKKPVRLEKVSRLVNYARDIGLDVNIFLVIGLPGETLEQMRENFRLAAKLKIYTPHISIATPYPGSELHDICVSKGYIKGLTNSDLHIRRFGINTEKWKGEEVRNVFINGQNYLLFKRLSDDPLLFLKDIYQKLYCDFPNTSRRIVNRLRLLFS